MSRELEIRFALPPKGSLTPRRVNRIGGVACKSRKSLQPTSIYYDTSDLRLAKDGLALRVREQSGKFTQTLKDTSQHALLSDRAEIEGPLPSACPSIEAITDVRFRKRIAKLLKGRTLLPLLCTKMKREEALFLLPRRARLTLALDTGSIQALRGKRLIIPVSEAELELSRGSTADLLRAALDFSRKRALRLLPESKAERGLLALKGLPFPTRKAGIAHIGRNCTVEEAFSATLLHCLRHLMANISAAGTDASPDSVHQLRVCLRRLRAAIAAFGPHYRTPAMMRIAAQAKHFSRIFSEARDIDVFLIDLSGPDLGALTAPGMALLRNSLSHLRSEAGKEVVRTVSSQAFTGFLLSLALCIETKPWHGSDGKELRKIYSLPAQRFAREALSLRYKKIRKRARHLDSMTIEERHAFRIALKKLRYVAEFFAPLFPGKKAGAFFAALSKLQDALGVLNDAANAGGLLRKAAVAAGEISGPELMQASIFVEGWYRNLAAPSWGKAQKLWRRFEKQDPFWER